MKGFKSRMERQMKSEMGGAGRAAGQQAGKDFNKGMSGVVAGSAKKIFAPLAVAAGGLALGGLFKDAIGEASDLGETVNALEVTYGKNAKAIQKMGKEAAASVGLSNVEFNNMAVQFSGFTQTIAGKGGDVVGTFKDLSTRGADFASVMNLDVNEAMSLFQSGLAGETEPLRKFGIDLSAAAVEAHAVEKGLVASGAAMTEQEKVQARYSLLMESTAKTQGDFANTSDSLANQQRILGARFDDTKAKLGEALLPVVTSMVTTINNNVIPAVSGFIDGMREGHGWGGRVADVLSVVKGGFTTAFSYVQENVIPALSSMVTWFKSNSTAIGNAATVLGVLSAGIVAYSAYVRISKALTVAWTAVTKGQTIAQRALNLVMRLNPIGLVIGALGGLIAILAIAYRKHEGFRNLVNSVWAAMREAVRIFIDYFQAVMWPKIRNTLTNVGDRMVWLRDKAVAAFDGIKNGISNAWGGAKKILDKFKSGLSSLEDRFVSVKNGIADTWSGLGAAIAKPINKTIDTVNRFLKNLKNNLDDLPGVNLTGSWGTIPHVPVPVGLSDSGSQSGRTYGGGVAAFATGGRVPGHSPTATADNIIARLTAGEFVQPVKTVQHYGAAAMEAVRQRKATILPGYAKGGLIGNASEWLGKLWDKGKSVVSSLYNRLMDGWGNSYPFQVAKGAIGSTAESVTDWIKKNAFGGGSGGAGRSGKGMPWQAIWNSVQRWAPEAVMTSNFRPGARTAGYGNQSYHALGRAVDIVSANMPATFMKLIRKMPWSEAIHTPMGNMQMRNGRYYTEMNPTTRTQHYNHIHLAMARGGLVPNLYDQGGLLQPGISLVANATGKPERVLTDAQWNSITAGGTTINITGVDTNNASDVADELLFAMRRTGKGKYNRAR